MIVRFFDTPAACGSSYDSKRGGCWLEAPQNAGADPLTSSEPPIAQAWNDAIAFSLPDKDVFTIDLSQSPPALLPESEFRSVGTNLFNLAVHPKTGKVFVSNTEARNLLRFEGPGEGESNGQRFASTSLRGHAVESRISVLDPATLGVTPLHLNAHIAREACCAAEPNADSESSWPSRWAATQALGAFVASLPAEHPGKVFERTALAQLSLPLLDCPSLPDAATLAAQGCFEVGFVPPPSCAATFFIARNCAAWGATLEQLLGSGTASCTSEGMEERREMEDFLFAYDSKLKPIVGQQVTLPRDARPAALARLDLLLGRARAGECDVVAHFSERQRAQRGALLVVGSPSAPGSSPGAQAPLVFLLDDGRSVSLDSLRDRGEPITFTAVPPGEGRRSGIDRDLDGVLDGTR